MAGFVQDLGNELAHPSRILNTGKAVGHPGADILAAPIFKQLSASDKKKKAAVAAKKQTAKKVAASKKASVQTNTALAQGGPEFLAYQQSQAGQDVAGTGNNIASQSTAYGISAKLAMLPIPVGDNEKVWVNKKTGKPLVGPDNKPIYGPISSKVGKQISRMTTIGDALDAYQKLSPNELAQVQQKLEQSGLLRSTPQNPIIPGIDDPNTFAQYQRVVQQAAREQRPVIDVLNELSSKGVGTAGGTSAVAISLTNPDTLKSAAQDAITKLTGGAQADPNFLNNFIAAYHSAETAQQQQHAAAVAAGATDYGVDVTKAASPQTSAQQTVLSQNPSAVGAYAAGQATDVIKNLIRSGH